jgi:hypothetical protein
MTDLANIKVVRSLEKNMPKLLDLGLWAKGMQPGK